MVKGLQSDLGQSNYPSSPGQHVPTYNHQQNVYDQRSLHVQVGVDPQRVLQMQNAAREHVAFGGAASHESC